MAEHKDSEVRAFSSHEQDRNFQTQIALSKKLSQAEGFNYIDKQLFTPHTAADKKELLETVDYLAWPFPLAVACIKNNFTLTLRSYTTELKNRLRLLIEPDEKTEGKKASGKKGVAFKQLKPVTATPQQILEEIYLISLQKIAGNKFQFSSKLAKAFVICAFFVDPTIISLDELSKIINHKEFSNNIITLQNHGLLETHAGILRVNPFLKNLIIKRDLIPEDFSQQQKAWIDLLLKSIKQSLPNFQNPAQTKDKTALLAAYLIHAADNNNTALIQLLLLVNANIHVTDRQGNTPLIVAAVKKHKEATQLLLLADITSARPQLQTLIPHALTSGELAMMKFFLEACHYSYLPQLTAHITPRLEKIAPISFLAASIPQFPETLIGLVHTYLPLSDSVHWDTQGTASIRFLTKPLPTVLIELIQSYLPPHDSVHWDTQEVILGRPCRPEDGITDVAALSFSFIPFLGATPYIDLFLFYVVRNNLSAVQTMLKKDKTLVLHVGKVGKYPTNITALSYALYLQLWEMSELILNYLPFAEARKQFELHGTQNATSQQLLRKLSSSVDFTINQLRSEVLMLSEPPLRPSLQQMLRRLPVLDLTRDRAGLHALAIPYAMTLRAFPHPIEITKRDALLILKKAIVYRRLAMVLERLQGEKLDVTLVCLLGCIWLYDASVNGIKKASLSGYLVSSDCRFLERDHEPIAILGVLSLLHPDTSSRTYQYLRHRLLTEYGYNYSALRINYFDWLLNQWEGEILKLNHANYGSAAHDLEPMYIDDGGDAVEIKTEADDSDDDSDAIAALNRCSGTTLVSAGLFAARPLPIRLILAQCATPNRSAL